MKPPLSSSRFFIPAKSVLFAQLLATRQIKSKRSQHNPLIAVLKILGEILIERPEPCVTEKHDRQGDLYFEAYDPLTEIRCWFGEEQEARIWIEQRHNVQFYKSRS